MKCRRGQDFEARKLLLETLTKGISSRCKEQKTDSSLSHPTGSKSVFVQFYAAVKSLQELFFPCHVLLGSLCQTPTVGTCRLVGCLIALGFICVPPLS